MLDLSGKTMNALLSSMLLRITEQVNKREGSLIRTALSAAAWVIEGLYIELIDVQRQAYGTTASGDYLDLKAEERGVKRIPATQAVYEMYADIGTLPIDFQFADSSSYTWNVTTAPLSGPDSQGLYLYHITCQTAGLIPEPAGQLRSLSFYAGLTTAFFGNVVVPGEDQEDDASLRKRYEESLVEIAFAGNVDAYREKILETVFEVSGGTATVGALQVYPTTDENGLMAGGHVKIWIVDSNFNVASQALVDSVQNVICPMYNGVATGDGYGWAPIGACVKISSATSTPMLAFGINLTLNSGVTLESVEDRIKSNIMAYIAVQKQSWSSQVANRTTNAMIYIREAFIYAAALVPGVADVTDVRIYKDGALKVGLAEWVTNGATMEWIVDSQVAINLHVN